jgi:drug/metabolite transporter (DMT)-like permease
MLGASLLFAAMGLLVKLASASLPNAMVVFFRNGFGLLALLPWVAAGGVGGLRTTRWSQHLLRGLAGLGSMYCFFYALARLPLAEAVLLNYSLPVFMPLIEWAWLRERLPARLWRPIALGFAGIALVLKPGLALFEPAAAVALLSALLASLAQVGVRRLTATEPPQRIVFYFGVLSTSLSAPAAALDWRTPPASLWLLLLALGAVATGGQLLLTRAYSLARAGRVGPFIYSSVVFAGLLDWMVRGALPDRLSLAGALLVAVAGVLALRGREQPAA